MSINTYEGPVMVLDLEIGCVLSIQYCFWESRFQILRTPNWEPRGDFEVPA
jgi:hypothetical protein